MQGGHVLTRVDISCRPRHSHEIGRHDHYNNLTPFSPNFFLARSSFLVLRLLSRKAHRHHHFTSVWSLHSLSYTSYLMDKQRFVGVVVVAVCVSRQSLSSHQYGGAASISRQARFLTLTRMPALDLFAALSHHLSLVPLCSLCLLCALSIITKPSSL